MKKTFLTLIGIFIAIATFASDGEDTYTLTIVIKKFKNTDGKARVAYFDTSEDFLKKGEGQVVDIPAKDEIVVTFENVKKGAIAVSVIHDENANGELDTGFLGIPTEDYGFSNDAKGTFGPPSFDACQVEMNENKTIEININ